MDDPNTVRLAINILVPLMTGAFAWGGAWIGVTMKVRMLERDVAQNHEALKEFRSQTREDIGKLHSRINRVSEQVRPANGRGA